MSDQKVYVSRCGKCKKITRASIYNSRGLGGKKLTETAMLSEATDTDNWCICYQYEVKRKND
jgi:hypothetical protein